MTPLTLNIEAIDMSLSFRMDALISVLDEENSAIEKSLTRPMQTGTIKEALLWTLRGKPLSLREVSDALNLSEVQVEILVDDLAISGLVMCYSVIGQPFCRLTEEGKRLVRSRRDERESR